MKATRAARSGLLAACAGCGILVTSLLEGNADDAIRRDTKPQIPVPYRWKDVIGRVAGIREDTLQVEVRLQFKVEGDYDFKQDRMCSEYSGRPSFALILPEPNEWEQPPSKRVVCRYAKASRNFIEWTTASGERKVLNRSFRLPAEFKADRALMTEKLDPALFFSNSYRLRDLVVGDEVLFRVDSRDEGPWIVRRLTIHRRPGGQVPRAPLDEKTGIDAHHVYMNIQQQWEENEIPMPPIPHMFFPVVCARKEFQRSDPSVEVSWVK